MRKAAWLYECDWCHVQTTDGASGDLPPGWIEFQIPETLALNSPINGLFCNLDHAKSWMLAWIDKNLGVTEVNEGKDA